MKGCGMEEGRVYGHSKQASAVNRDIYIESWRHARNHYHHGARTRSVAPERNHPAGWRSPRNVHLQDVPVELGTYVSQVRVVAK